MMADRFVDDKYYQAAQPRTLADRLVVKARARMYQDFMRFCRPGREDTILDVGVSDVVGESPNLLERLYPHGDRITALGLGSAEAFQAEYPEVAYLQVQPNAPLPFPDRFFPVEHHTGIPFMHYMDATFAPACRLFGKSEWADHGSRT